MFATVSGGQWQFYPRRASENKKEWLEFTHRMNDGY
jgi:hypothetical protein